MDTRRLVSSYGDHVLAGVVAVLFTGEAITWDGADLPIAAVFAATASLALAWRRTAPLVAFPVAFVGSAGVLWAAPGIDNDSLGFIVIFFVALYSLGRWTRGGLVWLGAVCVLGVVLSFLIGDARAANHAIAASDVGFAVLFVGTPWAAGVAIRMRREREQGLVEENVQAIARERARIARELHDVVSHAISVTVLQARGGRAQLGRDDEAVRRALDAIEQTNTAALSDMRRLLAVLRDTEGPDEGRAAPQPSLANLDRLVRQVREAGLPVELTVHGEPGSMPPGVDLSAYRIVQEALTNVLKHAGGDASAWVTVAYTADDLSLTVRDNGVGGEQNGAGHGLAGIRERVAVVGGQVDVGRSGHGGFELRARLPYALEGSS